MAFNSHSAFAQTTNASIALTSNAQGTIDSNRNAGPRFVRLYFDVLNAGEYTVSISWDSDADVRYRVNQPSGVSLSPTIRRSNPGTWIGQLDANTGYFIGLWSHDGVATYTATIEATQNNEPVTDEELAITSEPADLAVTEGESAEFSVEASGTGALSYQWFADGTPIADAINSTLSLDSVALADNGIVYTVAASDDNGTVLSAPATLSVNTAALAASVVTLGQGTLDSMRVAGPRFTRLDFNSLAGVEHTITVTWDSDADVRFLINEQDGTDVAPTVNEISPATWTGSLEADTPYFLGLWSRDGIANYTVTIETEQNNDAVTDDELAITSQPADVAITEGGDAQFAVEVTGSGVFAFQWFVDDVPITGANSNTLVVMPTSAADDGRQYSIEVSNGIDTVSSRAATLSVSAPDAVTMYSLEADENTWALAGPAPTLDVKATNDSDGWGRALLRIGDILWVGGDFNGIKTSRGDSNVTWRPWLFTLNAITGQPVTTFETPDQINNVVRALALSPDGTQVYVGGDFGLVAMNATTGLVEFEVLVADGDNVGRVFDIVVTDTQLYIGGDFTDIANTPRKNLARLSLLGEVDTAWEANVEGGRTRGRVAPVQSLALSSSRSTLYVGGTYTSINDTPVATTERDTTVSMLAISTIDGSVNAERFVPELVLGEFEDSKDLIVHDIAVFDAYILIAWGGPNYLTMHQTDGARLQQYQGPGDVQSIQILGDLVVVGHHGEFLGTLTNPIPPEAVESINPVQLEPFKLHTFLMDSQSGRLIPKQNWPINGTFGVWAIVASEDSLWIAGNLRRAGVNGRNVEGLVRFPAM